MRRAPTRFPNRSPDIDRPAAPQLGILSPEERQAYARDGIVFPIRVLSTQETHRYRTACDDLEAGLGGRPRTIEVRQMHLHFRWAYDLVTHPRLTDAVADVLGPDLFVWASELFAKHPFDRAVSIGWHQDRTYMGFDSGTTATAWIALGESTVENGCMQAIPDPARRVAELDESRAVDVVLRPGEMSLHDADIWHGSLPNGSGEKRVGFAVRYVTPAARPLAGRPPVVRARGEPASGHFEIVGPPAESTSSESLADALAALKHSATLHFDAVLGNLNRQGGSSDGA